MSASRRESDKIDEPRVTEKVKNSSSLSSLVDAFPRSITPPKFPFFARGNSGATLSAPIDLLSTSPETAPPKYDKSSPKAATLLQPSSPKRVNFTPSTFWIENEIPPEFRDPLTHVLMMDPYLCTLDLKTYEYQVVLNKIETTRTVPGCEKKLGDQQNARDVIYPNLNLKAAIERFMVSHPEYGEQRSKEYCNPRISPKNK